MHVQKKNMSALDLWCRVYTKTTHTYSHMINPMKTEFKLMKIFLNANSCRIRSGFSRGFFSIIMNL